MKFATVAVFVLLVIAGDIGLAQEPEPPHMLTLSGERDVSYAPTDEVWCR
jgi:hypothetical protein